MHPAVTIFTCAVGCIIALSATTCRVSANESPASTSPSEQASSSPSPNTVPALLPYPAEEDWSSLAASGKRSDAFDSIKFVPIDQKGGYVSFGGEQRLFYEAWENEGFGNIPGSDAYIQTREIFHADLHPDAKVRFYASFQTEGLGARPGGPRPAIDKDDADILESFAEYHSASDGQLTSNGVLVRAGRQQLDFGSGRLFSGRAGPDGEGPNVLGSFDGVRFAFRSDAWRVDVFAARPVNNEVGSFDDGPSAGNGTWGVYATHGGGDLGSAPKVDAYYFGVDRPDAVWYSGSGYETRHTVGFRYSERGLPTDYDLETFYQFGSNGTRRISAEGVEAQGGHTFAHLPLAPRVGILGGYNSGGGNAKNLHDMYPPFPRGGYFGNLRAIGPENTVAAEAELNLNPTAALALNIGSYAFWRSNGTDGIYNLDGSLLASDTNSNRYVGYQPFFTGIWHANSHLSIVLDYESFQRGSFLLQTPHALPTHYTAAWTEFRF